MSKTKKPMPKDILAPLGLYDRVFVTEVIRAHATLSMEQIAAYMSISIEEVEHILDLYLPILESMGSISYKWGFQSDESRFTL